MDILILNTILKNQKLTKKRPPKVKQIKTCIWRLQIKKFKNKSHKNGYSDSKCNLEIKKNKNLIKIPPKILKW